MPKHVKLVVTVTFILFALISLWVNMGHAAQDKVIRDYVAMVNGKKISKDKYERELASLENRFKASGRTLNPLQKMELKKNLLESLINRELLYQESQKRGITVDEAEVEKQFQAVKKQYANDDTFKQALQRANYTESGVRSQLKRAIAIERFIDQELKSKIKITDKEVKDYYDSHPDLFRRPAQIRASHILVKLSANPTKEEKEKALKEINEIKEKIRSGEDFGDLAKKYSDGPSAKRGGDLGFFSKGQMVKPFEDAAFALNVGQVSDVVETVFGYHLIKVTEKRPDTIMKFAEIKDRLKNYLVDQRLQSEVRQYTEGLKKKAKVERFLTDLP
ncbi:MAG: peptidylprolyl isomerase [Deltaproteobacteria bacterium]|nr:peptidylprolyl isomerase [Deltaproteobacteria bacterium]HDM10353.1 peptidylprolyl isomerase [Desulfobacteraceae bacterium]